MNSISPEELWGKVCNSLQDKVSTGVFRTWIYPNQLTDIQQLESGLNIVIESPTSFHITQLEKNFKPILVDVIEDVVDQKVNLSFRVGDFTLAKTPSKNRKKNVDQNATQLLDIEPSGEISSDSSPQPISPTVSSLFSQASIDQAADDLVEYKIQQAGLNRNNTFENFAVSSTNEMAHAAAVAVSQNPGKAYNVLFLYGGVGVGKTHLMQAVGQNILRENPNFTLIYRTGEEFMNEIVEAIQTKKTLQMKHRYRSVQILLIDDIQFMAGKRTMQEEFFHTFNSVIKSHGQVILTSDRPPHEINPLDDRIQSRLEGGLIIDIQQPTFELRTAIVLIKAKQINFVIPMDLAQRIAAAITSTRKLEGIIKGLHSEHILRKRPITQELVESILRQHIAEDQKQDKIYAKPMDIMRTIANQYHVKLMDLKGPKRAKQIATARHVAMYLIKHHLDLPLAEIGRYFGDRDHTSVMHAVRKVESGLSKDEDLRTQVQAVRTSLSGSTTPTASGIVE